MRADEPRNATGTSRDAPDESRDDEESRRIREAGEAHGGSMAPGLVDETGHPVTDPPPADDRG